MAVAQHLIDQGVGISDQVLRNNTVIQPAVGDVKIIHICSIVKEEGGIIERKFFTLTAVPQFHLIEVRLINLLREVDKVFLGQGRRWGRGVGWECRPGGIQHHAVHDHLGEVPGIIFEAGVDPPGAFEFIEIVGSFDLVEFFPAAAAVLHQFKIFRDQHRVRPEGIEEDADAVALGVIIIRAFHIEKKCFRIGKIEILDKNPFKGCQEKPIGNIQIAQPGGIHIAQPGNQRPPGLATVEAARHAVLIDGSKDCGYLAGVICYSQQ